MTSCYTILAKGSLIRSNSNNYGVSETQADLQKLAKGFLGKALEDIRASEILYRENLKDLAIFHLEQASEKILKAYIINILGVPLKYLLGIYEFAKGTGAFPAQIPDNYKESHQKIKDIINELTNPKKLGHDLAKFLDKELRDLYCKAGFEEYLEFLGNGLVNALYKQKQKLIEELLNEGLDPEQAESEVNSSINFISQFFELLSTSIRTSNSINALCKEEASSSLNNEESSKGTEKSLEPCIHREVETYKSIITKFRVLIDNALKKKPQVSQSANNILTSSTASNYENLIAFEYFYNIIATFPMFTLHLCLYKYYNISRYPEGEIPEEEYEAIPGAIELLKEVHKTVERMIRF